MFLLQLIEDTTYFHDKFYQLTIMNKCWFIWHLCNTSASSYWWQNILCGEDHCYICYPQVNVFVTIVIVIYLTFCFVSQNSKHSVYHIWFARGLIYLFIYSFTYLFLRKIFGKNKTNKAQCTIITDWLTMKKFKSLVLYAVSPYNTFLYLAGMNIDKRRCMWT